MAVALFSDPEADSRVAESFDDPECLGQFLRDALRSGEDTDALCGEVVSEADIVLPAEEAGLVKLIVARRGS
jgi:hypothetical protein